MDDFEKRVHRTWLAMLLEGNLREIAALVVDAEIYVLPGNFQPKGISAHLPPSSYLFFHNDDSIRKIIIETLKIMIHGHLYDQNGNPLEEPIIDIRVKLLDVEDNWRSIIKELIVNAKNSNQGVVTEKVFARTGKQVFLYNEMKFGSQSEIRIAQELERRKVLFFPLPLAIRNETGNFYEDHREVDFLVCFEGAWGILEVSYHPDRYEKDAEKDFWFKKSGILCVQHYTAERCYNYSSEVVDEFLGILLKHKRW